MPKPKKEAAKEETSEAQKEREDAFLKIIQKKATSGEATSEGNESGSGEECAHSMRYE